MDDGPAVRELKIASLTPKVSHEMMVIARADAASKLFSLSDLTYFKDFNIVGYYKVFCNGLKRDNC